MLTSMGSVKFAMYGDLVASTPPPTTDLQRMHQDEWLASLRAAEEKGIGEVALYKEPRCVLGRAVAIMEEERECMNHANMLRVAEMFEVDVALLPYVASFSYQEIAEWLGISALMAQRLYKLNDGERRIVQRRVPVPVAVQAVPQAPDNIMAFYTTIEECWMQENGKSFNELADWFKGQRDAYDGNLTRWDGER